LSKARRTLKQQQQALGRLSPQGQVDAHRQQVDDLSRQAARLLAHRLALRRSDLAGLSSRLEALNPLATLERGYAIVRREDSGDVVRSVSQVSSGQRLKIRVSDGEFEATARDES
jgi:exodeoxyribonuclease VII large subunit